MKIKIKNNKDSGKIEVIVEQCKVDEEYSDDENFDEAINQIERDEWIEIIAVLKEKFDQLMQENEELKTCMMFQ